MGQSLEGYARMDEPSVDHTARGLASEAIQAFRSHDAMDMLRFKSMDDKQEEIRILIGTVVNEMRAGFKSYDNKFWSLAVMVIGFLLTIVGVLLVKFVLK